MGHLLSRAPGGGAKRPTVLVTDKLRSYAAAEREIMPGIEHRQSRYLSNRAEVSHEPTRRRERQMRRFKSARHAHRFLSTHSRIHNHFPLCRHRLLPTCTVLLAMPLSVLTEMSHRRSCNLAFEIVARQVAVDFSGRPAEFQFMSSMSCYGTCHCVMALWLPQPSLRRHRDSD